MEIEPRAEAVLGSEVENAIEQDHHLAHNGRFLCARKLVWAYTSEAPLAGQLRYEERPFVEPRLVLSPDTARVPAPVSLLHGGHLRYSRYLIDPLFTHHAILEDELRVNAFLDSGEEGEDEWRTSLEVAYAFSDALGAEVFIPVVRMTGTEASAAGIGDIEVQPFKWSFLRKHELILTTVLAVVVPTGDAERGFGEGRWSLEPHFFMDVVVSKVALQANLIYGFVEGGDQEFEFSTSFARMFFLEETTSLGPMLEFMGGLATRGDESGRWEELGVAPGAKLQIGGWHFGAGVRFPLINDDPSTRLVVITAGYHVSF